VLAGLGFRDRLKTAGASLAAIAAWALLMYRSSGTLLYPLFPGNQRLAYAVGSTLADRMHAIALLASNPAFLFLLIPLAAAILFVRGPHFPFSLAAIAGSLMIPFYLPFSDAASIFRYVQPLAYGSFLIAAASLHRARKAAIVLGMVVLPVWAMYASMTVRERASELAALPARIRDRAPLFPAELDAQYRRIESAAPAGASILAILPAPSLLEYRSHRILHPDMIGCASPAPGMPFHQGPVALKQYLLSLGIEYIAFNDFDRPAIETGYWRPWWRDHAAAQNPVLKPVAPLTLDLMDNVDRLALSEEIALRDGDLTLIHLHRDVILKTQASKAR
jgi:hypothetical protein